MDQNLMKLVNAACAQDGEDLGKVDRDVKKTSGPLPVDHTSTSDRKVAMRARKHPSKKNQERSELDNNAGKVFVGKKEDLLRMNIKPSFPEELMVVLDDRANSDVLAWTPGGEAFVIVNPRQFAANRLHTLFHIHNMSSFVRKLSRWGFTRCHEKGTASKQDTFHHEYFRRGRKDLLRRIRCIHRLTKTTGQSNGNKAPQQPKVQGSPTSLVAPTLNCSPPRQPLTTSAFQASQHPPANYVILHSGGGTLTSPACQRRVLPQASSTACALSYANIHHSKIRLSSETTIGLSRLTHHTPFHGSSVPMLQNNLAEGLRRQVQSTFLRRAGIPPGRL